MISQSQPLFTSQQLLGMINQLYELLARHQPVNNDPPVVNHYQPLLRIISYSTYHQPTSDHYHWGPSLASQSGLGAPKFRGS